MDLFNGFNFLNTIIYSIIIITFYFLFFKVISKYNLFKPIKINFNFISSIIPFLVLGSIIRILEQDYSVLNLNINCSQNIFSLGFYFCTPGFLILISFLYLFFLLVSLYLQKINSNLVYYKILNYFFYTFTIILLLYLLLFYINLFVFFTIIISCILLLYLIFILLKIFKITLLNSLINKIVLFSELLDSVSTISGKLYFPGIFIEKHILSRFILNINPFLFLFLKIIFTLLFLYLVDRYIKEKELNYYFKLLIIILGFLTGFRTTLTVSLLS